MSSRPVAKNEPPSKKQKTKEEPPAPDDDGLQEVYEKLEHVQEKIEKLNEEAAEEIIQVEKKFNQKRKPSFEERSVVIKQIPHFWKRVFSNHPMISDCLSEEDLKILDYLEDVIVEDFDNIKEGHRISFKFKPNPWFSNHLITKEFRINDNGELAVVPPKVDWKEGKDITQHDDNDNSFFSIWLSNDEETSADIADLLKEELWVSPSKYYHGLVEEEGEDGEDGEDDDQ